MKKLISLFLILSMLPASSFAALSEVDNMVANKFKDFIHNGGFENGSAGWTASGGATATANVTAKGTGNLGYDWDSNSASQTLTSKLIAVPPGLRGKDGMIACGIKTVSGTATHTLGMWDGTTLTNTQTIVSDTNTFAVTKINVRFPTSGSVAARLTSVASNEPEIYIDDCVTSLPDNIGTVQQALDYGSASWTGNASCIWTHAASSTVPTSYTANASCNNPSVTGSIAAPATKIPAITFPSMAPGTYEISASGLFSTEINRSCTFFLYDGTTSYPAGTIVGSNPSSANVNYPSQAANTNFISVRVNVTTPQSNKTFEIQGIGENGTSTCQLYADSTPKKDLKIWVKYFPSSSEKVLNAQTSAISWSGAITGCATAPTVNSGTFADFNLPASCAITTYGSPINMGTVSVGPSGTSISFTPARTGRYLVINSGSYYVSSTGSSGQLALADGSNNYYDYAAFYYNNNNLYGTNTLSGIINVTSTASPTVVKVRGTSSLTITQQPLSSGQNSSWKIIALDQSLPSPLITGNVITNAVGTRLLESAQITKGVGSCTVTSQSHGSWTCASNGTGDSTITLAGYTSTPHCICTGMDSSASTTCTVNTATAPSATTYRFNTYSNGNSIAEKNYIVFCYGSK